MTSLPSGQLDAFVAIARELRFSRAAETLHLSQPALSVRIRQLEELLAVRLFLRGQDGVTLTEAGARLLRYCVAKEALEAEAREALGAGTDGTLGGTVRIAGFSSVVRSVVVPAIGEILRENPRLHVDVRCREMAELGQLLERAGADFVLLDRPLERPGVEHVLLGHEEWVVIESERHPPPPGVYLDHDVDDTTTLSFLRANRRSTRNIERRFFDEIYCIFDGVAVGAGRAVVSRHLFDARSYPGVRVVPGFKSVEAPVYLCHYAQPSYAAAHRAIREALVRGAPGVLGGGRRRR